MMKNLRYWQRQLASFEVNRFADKSPLKLSQRLSRMNHTACGMERFIYRLIGRSGSCFAVSKAQTDARALFYGSRAGRWAIIGFIGHKLGQSFSHGPWLVVAGLHLLG